MDTPEYVRLLISALRPSPTNPRSPDEQPDEGLTESIRLNDIIQPLIVRPIEEKGEVFYEIAAGHRRRINAIAAGLTDAPCVIRHLTDDQMLDFHIHENIHRLDLGPMEEAKVYKLMQDRGNKLAEIAVRSGKSVSYVAQRLKLNDLIPDLQADLSAGYLPLTHAFVLCRFSTDAQTAAMDDMYGSEWTTPADFPYEIDEDNGDVIDKDGNEITDEDTKASIYEEYEALEPVKVVDKRNLQFSASRLESYLYNKYTLNLANAMFDLNDVRLREDKLRCPLCPERTGANPTLFETDEGVDFCLNRSCFEAKSMKFIQITREATATAKGVPVEKVVMIASQWHNSGLPEGWVGRQGVNELEFEYVPEEGDDEDDVKGFVADAHCEFEQPAIKDNGEAIMICHVGSGCAIHHEQNTPEWKARYGSNGSMGYVPKTEEEELADKQAAGKKRKEELWNVKVGEETRLRIITEAATKFSEGVDVIFEGQSQAMGAIMGYTTARLWQTVGYNDGTILKRFTDKLGIDIPASSYGVDHEGFVQNLNKAAMQMFYFILTHYWKGDMRGNSWTDQTKVKELAVRHGVNYDLIDAEVRVELSAKKHEKRHKAYLQQVEVNDPQARIPLLYTEDVEKPVEKTPTPEPAAEAPVENAAVETELDAIEADGDKAVEAMTPEEIAPVPKPVGEVIFASVPKHDFKPDEALIQAAAAEAQELFNEAADTAAEPSALDVVCPLCIAMPGIPCIAGKGPTEFGFHAERTKLFSPLAAVEAAVEGDVCLSCGKPTEAGVEVCVECGDEPEDVISEEGDAFGTSPEQSMEEAAQSLSDLFDAAIED